MIVFEQNPVALNFAPGAQFYFSLSLLKGIMDTIHNALVIQLATFLREWLSLEAPEPMYNTPCTPAPPGLPSTRWPAPAPAPSPPALAQSKREDTHHPKLRLWTRTSYGTTMSSTFGHTHIVRKANDGPPNPSTILPSYRSPVHLLEQCIGEMLPGPPAQVCQRPCTER